MVRDIRSDLKAILAFEPQTINTDTTTAGEIIDTQEYDGGIDFVVSIAHTCGDVTPIVKGSDSATFSDSGTALDDAYLVGDVATAQEADSKLDGTSVISSLGVIGSSHRYLQLSLVSANSANLVASAIAVGSPKVKPATN